MQASNPEYNFSSSVENFSIGEILAPFVVFGDRDAVEVNRTWVEFFFGMFSFPNGNMGRVSNFVAEHERLPTSFGWKPQEKMVNLEDITELMGVFFNATNLITGAPAEAGVHKRMDFHTPML